MIRLLRILNQRLDLPSRIPLLAFALCGVLIVGGADYLSGYEVSISLFYLGPVAVAAWYGGKWTGITVAFLSCISWFIADFGSGHLYSNLVIPFWNALVRFGFFVTTALLLTGLRRSLRGQQHLARTDSLTGLYGRRAFEDRLEHDLVLAHRRKAPLTLAYVDVDDFKAINETHGHKGGDDVLRIIGRVFKGSLREADTAARIGGDEFALVLTDTDKRGAQQIISKLARDLRETFAAADWLVTCSIGVVTFLDPTISPERAVAAADEAMFRAKHTEKGAIEFSVLGKFVQPDTAGDEQQVASC